MYRAEHPRPQLRREEWLNLNGEWDFEFDFSKSGLARGMSAPDAAFSQKINLPFCPESSLSGIGYTDFINAVWYRRSVVIPDEFKGRRAILHFGAVDYYCTVFVNGARVGDHMGGYSPFSFDITDFLKDGENIITVYAEDDTRATDIPSGKQSHEHFSFGCYYTRTTGIWQTVWLEFVPENHIKSVRIATDIASQSVTLTATLCGRSTLKAEVLYNGKRVGFGESDGNVITVRLDELHLWELGKGRLYELALSFGDDRVKSYFGMREIGFDGHKFLLNGKSVFQRLVLDQGFYPDGIYTASSDSELENDIKRSMALGFNGARLHEKVFEERFLYHCDRLGYMVWGEYPSWGLDISKPESVYRFLPEWLDILNRDINHPSIIGWCPFNETWDYEGRRQCDDVLSLVYRVTKSVDPTRPCIDTSGNFHVITDVFDVHDYDSSGDAIRARYRELPNAIVDKFDDRQKYAREPIFISEYGGIGFLLDSKGWGYGNIPESKEAFLARLKDVTDAILENKYIFGFCYTQLTDVEQECNGLYTYDRICKFDPDDISAIIGSKAAIED